MVTGRCLACLVALGLLCGWSAQAEEKAPPAGTPILTEASVWRTQVTWGKAQMQGPGGVKDAGIRGDMTGFTAPPPENWAAPDFDDSEWSLWRETHAPNTLKLKDGKDTGVRVYDEWQYGIQLSCNTALRCLRGKFRVDDPAQVKSLTLSLAYRGGVVVYLNGQEVGRAHVPKPAAPDRLCPAEPYPDEFYYGPNGKLWSLVNNSQTIPGDPAALERFNKLVRTAAISLPGSALRKGVNVLAIEVHRAPLSEKAMSERERESFQGWSSCGLATIELRAEGAVTPAVTRPKGIQVWNANILTKVSPFGSVAAGRVGAGAGVRFFSFPLSWAPAEDRLSPIRIAAARNGVFSGQVVISSDSAIRGAKAIMGDLASPKSGGKIPASACQVCYSTFPQEPPAELTDPSTSLLDALHEQPPAEVPVTPAKPQAPTPLNLHASRGLSWSDGVAMAVVWLKVRVPADAPPGDYEGVLTVSAEGLKPVEVPVKLTVHGFVLPAPKDWTCHAGLVHSPDTLALKYKVPVWSDQHFKLMDKTLAYMGEAGGKVVWIPLVADTWLGNRQGMVYWVKQGDSYKYDFKVFDRYLDMVQKHLKPEAVNVYVYHPLGVQSQMPKCRVSALDQAGKEGLIEGPAYTPGPQAEAFWKPVIAEVRERLRKRGLPEPSLALVQEQGWSECMPQVADLFKAVWPEGKWAQLAHGGGSKGGIYGVPYGYVMSVWGLGYSPWKAKKWGAPEVPCVFIEHFRADRLIDLRPTGSRGAQYWAAESAMAITQGIGPLGMDFWNLTPEEGGWKSGGPRCLEVGVCNLNMSVFTAAAFLAPGPDGPVSTARFEIFRQGLETCEARTVVQRALEDPAKRGRLGEALARKCEDVVKRRSANLGEYAARGEGYAQGEGWKWFETCDWQELDGQLFDCAEQVVGAAGSK